MLPVFDPVLSRRQLRAISAFCRRIWTRIRAGAVSTMTGVGSRGQVARVQIVSRLPLLSWPPNPPDPLAECREILRPE